MKSLKQIATAAMLTLVATAAYSEGTTVTAKIPFAFRADGSDMPAGSYRISRVSGSSTAIEVRNVVSRKSVLLQSNYAVHESEGRTRLVFRCGAGDCALTTLWSGSGSGLEFAAPAPTAAQRERQETVYFSGNIAK